MPNSSLGNLFGAGGMAYLSDFFNKDLKFGSVNYFTLTRTVFIFLKDLPSESAFKRMDFIIQQEEIVTLRGVTFR